MREWTQDNKLIQQGTHFPLCIKLGKIATRSKAKQLERSPGADQYKAKQAANYPQGRPAYRSQQNQPPGGYATTNKNRYGHVRPQPMTPSPAAQAAVSTKIMCNDCGGYDCTGTCPGLLYDTRTNEPTADSGSAQSSAQAANYLLSDQTDNGGKRAVSM